MGAKRSSSSESIARTLRSWICRCQRCAVSTRSTRFAAEFPEARIVVLTTCAGDSQVKRALQAGAYRYLLKGLLRKELLDTIRAVHGGRKHLNPEIAAEIAEHVMDPALSPREIDILKLIAEGNANKEIAAQLHISEEGVKVRSRVFCSNSAPMTEPTQPSLG